MEDTKSSVLAPEYPGYGCFKKEIETLDPKRLKTKTRDILSMTKDIFYWATKKSNGGLGFEASDIFVWGRSIGTGPASYMANDNPGVKGLILVSPYTSLKKLASSKTRYLGGFGSWFIEDNSYENDKCMETISCPVLIIHGEKDIVIPWQMSDELSKILRRRDKLHDFKHPYEMTHHLFDFSRDILNPAKQFMSRL